MAARILIVEDNPAIQELIAVNRSRAGYEVARVCDAEEATQRLAPAGETASGASPRGRD